MNRIRRAMEREGAETRKRHGTVNAVHGDPDIQACFEGHHIEIEVKHPDETHPLEKAQIRHLNRWARAGARVGVAESVEEALDIMHGNSPW